MKRTSLILAAALATFNALAADSLTMADFVYTNKLMVAGYTGSETLTDFPVLVRVSTSLGDFQYSRMRSTKGGDLAFFAADGTRLASEVDTWTTSGTSLVWVKLPSMAQGTIFYMCYRLTDDLAALDTMVENPNPWGDYVGVWHMRETGGKSTDANKVYVNDSTDNELHGVTASTGSPAGVSDGRIGRARHIATDSSNKPSTDSGITIDLSEESKRTVVDNLGSEFTASMWVRVTADFNYFYLISRKNADAYDAWGAQTMSTSDAVGKTRMWAGNDGEKNVARPELSVALAAKNEWHKLDFIWKADGTYEVYQDGGNKVSGDLYQRTPAKQGSLNLSIGGGIKNPNTGVKGCRGLNGDMDEVRLRVGALSAAWVKADYDTVYNEQFVTPAPPEVTWENSSGATPGVSNIHPDYIAFGGTVTGCGGFANCSIQCKVWATGGTEPENWTTLTNGLVAADVFSVAYSGLAPGAAYSYKLRVAGEGNVASVPVSGSFTTLVGFAVTWSSATEATGLSVIHHDCVVVAGEVTTLENAESFEVQWKCWADGTAAPESWTTITNVLGAVAFEVAAGELASGSTYNYALRAVANDGETTTPVVGTFTTLPGLTVAWDGTAGIVQVGYDFVKIGGTVVGLGEATSCIVQRKIWVSGESEPDWATFKTGLVRTDSFTDMVTNLMAGTAYSYKLRAYGNDDETTEVVEGTFTTRGEEGETIGSKYTHFFDDGTNSFWVVNDFERYLPFTVTGYTGTETLTNFPVLVEVRAADTNGFTYDDFYHYDGKDIAFVDEKGHIIPHEIDTWNKNGMSLFWVRLPEMNNGTTFTMCYRSPLLETPPDPGNTFEKYVGVWHMNEHGDGVVNLKDSTVNNFETETHALSLAENNGRIGYARRVAQKPGSSSSFGRIIAFDHDDILRTGVGNVFTFSSWYKLHEAPAKWAYLVSRKSEDADKGWGIQYDEKDTTTILRVWSGSSAKGEYQLFKTPGMSSTGWNYWTFSYDGSVNPDGTTNRLFHAYLNGEELYTTTTNFVLRYEVVNDDRATYDHLVIGGQQNGTGAFNGLVDEARYSKGLRSADWIKAEYDSTMQQVNWQDANKRFVTKGTVSHGTDSLVPVVVWEHGAGLPDTILDVSYAYVQFAGTVTYCGAGAEECRIEYLLWVDGEQQPETWTTLVSGLRAGQYFSIPITGLKQDMLYNFSIRAVNNVDGEERQNHEHAGHFRTTGNMTLGDVDGELFRLGDKFVHRYRAGSYTFTTPDYVTNVEIIVVGGGGAGGYKVGGGGGGGGVFHSLSFPVTTSTVYRVQVGKGGVAASDLTERSENGEISYFALASDEANPLIRMHGGGAGGSYAFTKVDKVNVAVTNIAIGADGASGGGGTYALDGGKQAMLGLPEEFRPFGHVGGHGNDYLKSGSIGKVAAGGGGGAGRAGLGATFDAWSAGGAGGVGVGSAITGEMLFYGAGGGGGYIYRTQVASDGSENFTKPGGGGSGIGGNAADVRNGIPATSGVANTGAGGGGGSSRGKNDGSIVDETDSTYWQGGNGGDGVVLIAYEAHGRDPISEEPRITMTACDYTDEKGYADITYRAYWAGIQAQTNDIYVLYSTVSEEDVLAGNGELVNVKHGSIGIATTTFTPPAVGYTYWVRIVARKDANSFMYSDEVGTFEVPAIRLTGATWHMPNNTDDNNNPSNDYANVFYSLYDTAPDARLYCYWSENRADLEGDAAPTGASVHFLDLGTGKASQDGEFTIPATEGLERDKVYYIRLATGNEAGTKYFLSKLIVELETIDKPRVIFPFAKWENHKAEIEFLQTTSHLDPDTVELYALYGTEADIKGNNPFGKAGVNSMNLGKCSIYPDDVEAVTQFPLWSPVDTNYYMRLALVTNNAVVCYSQRSQYLNLISAVPTNTLLVYVNADAKIGCYGDEPQPLTHTYSYGGYTAGPGWDKWQSEGGHLTGSPSCEVTSTSPSGQYDIEQGDLALSNGGQTYFHNEPVIDPETGEQARDENNDPVFESVPYYYELIYTGSRYVVTNAQFTVSIADARTIYTGEDFNVTDLETTVVGLRNEQPISYMYRVGTNDWASTITTTYSDIWTHIVQFKATAPSHDEVRGTFMITVDPAPLSATISAEDLNYLAVPQVPNITTNVTGHVRPDLNPLTVEFRDEADEWQGEVPSFTLPGTYKLFFRVSAPNHTPFATNCTFTVKEWDYWVNMDGKEGFKVPINISDPAWLLRTTGEDAAHFADNTDNKRYKNLDRVCDNGLKLWQNYMIDRTDLSKRLVAVVRQNGDRVNENCFVVHFPNVEAIQNTGLNVFYRLDRKLKGESAFTKGALSDKYEMNVPLGPGDPTGLYVFNIVFTPTNNASTGEAMYGGGEAVLASIATVGVIRVSSALTNTVTTAPWKSLTVGTEEALDVSVSDVINPNSGIGKGDAICSYNVAATNFNVWEKHDGWTNIAVVTKRGMAVVGTEASRFAPGKAFWLIRNAPTASDGSTNHIYLVGRYTGEDYVFDLEGGTVAEPGYTLVANPTFFDIDLNELIFIDGEGNAATPTVGDRIVTQNISGLQTIYYRNAANAEWGRNITQKVTEKGRIRTKQVWSSGGTIPSGTGFWYNRTGEGTLRIKFEASK